VRSGTRLGVDVGLARVGVARSDTDGLMAVPVATLPRDGALDELARLVAEYSVLEVLVGLPRSLAGRDTASTDDAHDFATALSERVPCDVRMIDERLSTVQATAGLRQAGKSAKKQRGVIDQVAAVILLQHALDVERNQGVAPGVPIGNPVTDND